VSKQDLKRPSRTDWARIDALQDEDIDYSEIPEQGEDFFTEAVLWQGNKKQITLRLDPDVLEFFKQQGKGYQKIINSVLRKYMETQQNRVRQRAGENSSTG
jgi:uncharacterized protein (DUF4415 family)